MNKLNQIGVKVGMLKLTIFSKLLLVVCVITLSSCVKPLGESNNDKVRTPSIIHSSPDVMSLHQYENAHSRDDSRDSLGGKMMGSLFGSLVEGMFDSLLGSNPDDARRAGKRKRDFVDKNRETIVKDLESKKD